MTTSLCNASGLQSLLDALKPSNANAQLQARSAADIAREARSMAVSANAGAKRVGFAASMQGEFLQGIRNRLFLKYAGIDYEYYNFHDLRYRDSVSL